MIAARCRAQPPARAASGGFAGRVSEVLAGEVFERLAWLDRLAAGEPRSQAEVARIRQGLDEAVSMWRRLLERHRADGDDRCPQCRSWCGLRRARWPCRVWLAAHSHLITGPLTGPP